MTAIPPVPSFPLKKDTFSGLSNITNGILPALLNELSTTTDAGNATAITTLNGEVATLNTEVTALTASGITANQRTAITALTAVSTANAVDLTTSEALANACKVAINAIIAALQHA